MGRNWKNRLPSENGKLATAFYKAAFRTMTNSKVRVRRIGIDFGTTNSAAGMFEQKRLIETLSPGRSPSPLPTLIAYNQDEFRFGVDALQASRDLNDGSLIISEIKPKLGRMPRLQVESMSFNLEELAARYIKFLVNQLFGGLDVESKLEAVIGTPVEFPPSHRAALRNAAMQAGFEKIDFVYEPTAAVYYALQKYKQVPEGPVAVVDWGGGTVDITIARCESNPPRIEDLNVNARSAGLGGRDIDAAILSEALQQSDDARTWYDGSSRSVKNAIMSRLERGKIYFLENHDLEKFSDFWHPETPPELHPFFRLNPSIINSCLNRFVDRVRRLAIETTCNANLSPEDVEHFLLVGGPCQSPLVRQRLSDIWPNAREMTVEHRQRATVRGCTMLAERGFNLALGADIVVRQFDDRKQRILERGQPFMRSKGQFLFREFTYRVVDFSSPQAVLEIGYIPQLQGDYVPLEIMSVPVTHRRDESRRTAIPYDVKLRIGLDEHLYVCAVAQGKIEDRETGSLREVTQSSELSRVPLILLYKNEATDE